MHFKNGRTAKVGDIIVAANYAGQPFTGIITSISPGSGTCNAQMVPLPAANSQSVTLKECMHVEDAVTLNRVPTPYS